MLGEGRLASAGASVRGFVCASSTQCCLLRGFVWLCPPDSFVLERIWWPLVCTSSCCGFIRRVLFCDPATYHVSRKFSPTLAG